MWENLADLGVCMHKRVIKALTNLRGTLSLLSLAGCSFPALSLLPQDLENQVFVRFQRLE